MRPVRITEISRQEKRGEFQLPLVLAAVAGGFPSPADDFVEEGLDLNDYVVKNRASTFFVRVEGDSMQNAGIFSGDILVVDKALQAADNRIVVAIVDGEFTVKRIKKIKERLYLVPENEDYAAMEIAPESDFQVWGVVTFVIHKPQ